MDEQQRKDSWAAMLAQAGHHTGSVQSKMARENTHLLPQSGGDLAPRADPLGHRSLGTRASLAYQRTNPPQGNPPEGMT